MNSIRHFIVVACLVSIGACTTVMPVSRSGFLSSYSELTTSPDGSSASTRTATAIDPTRVTIGDIEWRAAAGADVSEEERRALLNRLSDELVARVRELPTAPDGRPIVLRAAITRVETVSPALNAVSALLFVIPLDRGGASVEVEAIDADTGKQVAGLTLGYFAPLSELKSRFSKLAPARLALSKAASDFGALLKRPAATSASAWPQRSLTAGPEHTFRLANPLYCRMVRSYRPCREDVFHSIPWRTPSRPASLDLVFQTGEPFVAHEYGVWMDRQGGGELEECFLSPIVTALQLRKMRGDLQEPRSRPSSKGRSTT